MSDVVITVRGESERRVTAEQAVVRITVRADGPERGPVVERVQRHAETVQDGLVAHQRSGEVSEWNSGRAAVWSERPWNSDGAQLPLVHHAGVDVSATFVDAAALSWWLGDVAESDEVQVVAVEWGLTPDLRARIEREVAADAVRAAVERAQAYADALGEASIVPIEIADLGLLGGRPEQPQPFAARALAAHADTGPGFSLQPVDVVIATAVEGRFRAS
ncbi:SIMPL domain-containing protein [Microbacterium enclense]|uniref:SIMPL domain-containing protein n=1 Tax=Microbacterium enclense TaxID=993073 RepID=UPI0036D766A7